MKKSLLLLLPFVIIVSSLLIILSFGRLPASPLIQTNPEPVEGWRTYSNDKYRFELKFPVDFTLYPEARVEEARSLTYIPVCDVSFSKSCLYLPAEKYPNTNFAGAGLSVNLLIKATTETSCQREFVPGSVDTGEKIVNGIKYSTASLTGAAAGNQNQDFYYKTFQSSHCFQITVRLTTNSADMNTEPIGSVKKFTESDKQGVLTSFNQILSTLKFTK